MKPLNFFFITTCTSIMVRSSPRLPRGPVRVQVEVDAEAVRPLRARFQKYGLKHEVLSTDPHSACPSHELWRQMPEHTNRPPFAERWSVRGPEAALRQALELPDSKALEDKVHYPPRERRNLIQWYYGTDAPVQPKHPVYVISKGRWETNFTSQALDRMGVKHLVVVEPKEYERYAQALGGSKLLRLPSDLSELNQGSIPVRNFVWAHALERKAKKHWILDDNIRYFFRRNHNMKVEALTGAVFRAMEDFMDRFTNVAIAGPHYDFFVPDQSSCYPEFNVNTRVYSCLLIDHNMIDDAFSSHPELSGVRWRGKYNEDTDLCLRVLKQGLCTLLFNAFLQKKVTTMVMKGGNTDSVYKRGRKAFVRSLVRQHSDVARSTVKFGRDHHHVDYSRFKETNLLQLKPGTARLPRTANNYGMVLRKRERSGPVSKTQKTSKK